MRRVLVLAALALALAGCGSLGRESSKPWAATQESETARPVSVAWTSARASKCGFSFDPARLRATYLASESKNGATPEALQKAEQAYDFTLARTSKTLAGTPGYCSKERLANIRLDLNRHLAGDFAPGKIQPTDKVEDE